MAVWSGETGLIWVDSSGTTGDRDLVIVVWIPSYDLRWMTVFARDQPISYQCFALTTVRQAMLTASLAILNESPGMLAGLQIKVSCTANSASTGRVTRETCSNFDNVSLD